MNNKDLASVIAQIAELIREVPQCDTSIGVCYWKQKVPGCFFCNAVRFGVLTEQEAEEYEYEDSEGWKKAKVSEEDSWKLLFVDKSKIEVTGEEYYQAAQEFLRNFKCC